MKAAEQDKNKKFLLIDEAGIVTEISDGAREVFGLDSSKVGAQISTFLHSHAFSAEGEGSIAVLEPSPGTMTPVFMSRATLTGTQVLHLYDLTDAESYEMAFTAGTSLPAQLIAQLPVGIVVQFQDARILSANSAAARILGLSLEELLGRTSIDPRWRAIKMDGTPFPGEHHPAMVCLRTGANTNEVFGVVAPLGGRRWLDVAAQPLITHDGHVLAATVSFIDVTAEVESFSEAQMAVSRYETMLSEGSSHVLITNSHGVITYAAPKPISSLSKAGRAATGENFLTLITDDTRIEASHLLSTLESRQGSRGTCTVKLDIFDAAPRWFEISIRNMIDDPKIDGLIISASDVDDRVRDAAKLLSLNLELQARLDERDEEHRVDKELSSTGEMISKCISESELEAVVVAATQRIFGSNNAQLFRSQGSGGVLQAVGGETGTPIIIDENECWSLRTEQLHKSPSSSLKGLRCAHLGPDDGPAICVPLGAAPRRFGLLTLSHLSPDTEQHALSFVNRIGPMLSISSGLEA